MHVLYYDTNKRLLKNYLNSLLLFLHLHIRSSRNYHYYGVDIGTISNMDFFLSNILKKIFSQNIERLKLKGVVG